MDKILTVIVFTYNHENYIEKCLDSVLEQKTNFEFEVIIADDCSIDKTLEIVKRRNDKRLRINKQRKNVGLCRNMYDNFNKSGSKYIFECSGDDYLCNNTMFQKHVDFLENHNEYFSVFNWIVHRNESTGEEKIKQVPYSSFTMLDFLRGEKVLFYTGTMRNTFKSDKVDYLYKASKNNEEIQMLYYTLLKGKKKILPEAFYVYCYRSMNGGNNYNSTKNNLEMLEDYAKGFYAIEKVDNCRFSFNIAKLKYYESYIDRILETKDWVQIAHIGKILKWSDLIRFMCYKMIIRMNKYKIHQFMLNRKRLIKY